ncbi:leucine-rich repeat and immunoglobulin-like domain-containing nogo receptor-interacting protein 2 [Denticeps clupeoides]|uniref:leucine-rich repeat and immunoglobulin-like domain-containing nogo receptor-interacting protein 2 n=1 Tax=Denticeps clupeoides TaxID=299321 RepID=UPI0010A4D825|nr:leucine-rich repeat and immunoglobulin-like domain-containing nogo receptor-interacting protein 2 [Denticeps clupeoides]
MVSPSSCVSSLSLLLLPLLLCLGPARGCPARCDCSVQTRSVSCHRRRLATVPEGIPIETRSLDLSKNRLRSLAPQNFSQLQQLEDLDLSANLLSSVEPGSFRAQPRLRALRLRGNQLTLLPHGALAGLTELLLLDLSQNKLVILLDGTFEEQRRLHTLELSDNELVFIAPRAFLGLVSLRQFTLARCNLSAVPSQSLAHMHNLEGLRLTQLNIAEVPAHAFRNMPQLRRLELDRWPALDGLPGPALQGLNLSALSVTHTNLSAVPALGHMRHLTHVNMSYSSIRVLRAGALHGLARLQELRLRMSLLERIEPNVFLGAASLRLLDVTANRLATLERAAFPPALNLSLRTLMIGRNPLVCDCRLRWMLQSAPPVLHVNDKKNPDDAQPECNTPAALAGKPLLEVAAEPHLLRLATCTRPRVIAVATQPAQVEEGRRAWLNCSADGSPPPTLSWVTPTRRHLTTKSTGRVVVHGDGSLEVRVAERQDSGVYICVASNPAGNASLSASLAVKSVASRDGPPGANRSSHYDYPDTYDGSGDGNVSLRGNATDRYARVRVVLDFTTILVSTAMGCLSFLGVVLFCFLLLFAWSRGKGKHRGSVDIQYVPRKRKGGGTEVPETSGPRRVNMKMI